MSKAPVVVSVKDKLLLSVEEFAALVSIAPRRAWDLIGSGQVRSVKVGKRRLIPREAAEAFVQALVRAA